MTQDEIFEMAKRAGFMQHLGVICIPNVQNLEAFAALIRADEREACAKVCEELGMGTNGMYERNHECAAAIRARGNT